MIEQKNPKALTHNLCSKALKESKQFRKLKSAKEI